MNVPFFRQYAEHNNVPSEYIDSTIKDVNDKHAKKVLLFLSKERHKECTRKEIYHHLQGKPEDAKLEKKFDMHSQNIDLPIGVLLVPIQNIDLPNGLLIVPDKNIDLPNGVLIVPDQNIDLPNGVLIAPDKNIDLPNGVLIVPDIIMGIPNGVLPVPDTIMGIPNGLFFSSRLFLRVLRGYFHRLRVLFSSYHHSISPFESCISSSSKQTMDSKNHCSPKKFRELLTLPEKYCINRY